MSGLALALGPVVGGALVGLWNWRAVFATLLGCVAAWIGLVVPSPRPLYDYAWFVGFGVAAITHLLLMKAFRPRDLVDAEPVVT